MVGREELGLNDAATVIFLSSASSALLVLSPLGYLSTDLNWSGRMLITGLLPTKWNVIENKREGEQIHIKSTVAVNSFTARV
ncbi:hypothetical protein FKM82_023536 [Ascaphus truei]